MRSIYPSIPSKSIRVVPMHAFDVKLSIVSANVYKLYSYLLALYMSKPYCGGEVFYTAPRTKRPLQTNTNYSA